MCIIELVDFNELMLKDAQPAKKTTRRSRRSAPKATDSTESPVAKADDSKEENTGE
jgi:large subunit ribosomal protein L17